MTKKNLIFQDIQHAFSAHLKDPDNVPPPCGIENRRLEIYRKLFFKNIIGFINKTYPVLRSLYSPIEWEKKVKLFYASHDCKSPFFYDIAKEFLSYLQNEYKLQENDPVFLLELAHYEYIELKLLISDKHIDMRKIDPVSDLSNGAPVISPLAKLLRYTYPVHKISKDFDLNEIQQEPTNLIVNRRSDGKVHFVEINSYSALLLEKICEEKRVTGEEILEEMAVILNKKNDQSIIQSGRKIFKKLLDAEVIIGTKKIR